ncbi:MAG: hypothetical protein AAFU64_13025, partial [Bacteroidota bacterium]
MKNLKVIMVIVALAFNTLPELSAQSMSKPYKTLKVERVIKASAERGWQAMVLDYGEIFNFAPSIYASSYEKGSLKGELGAQRKCAFSENG